MLRLASDADFRGKLYRALLRRQPDLDRVRVQDAGLRTALDPDILAWAASVDRIVITHDRSAMPRYAFDRVRAGIAMPGVFVIRSQSLPLGRMVDEILIVALCSTKDEWKDRVVYLPL